MRRLLTATLLLLLLLFFFQAEDGIRDGTVTGVQTCALPILHRRQIDRGGRAGLSVCQRSDRRHSSDRRDASIGCGQRSPATPKNARSYHGFSGDRSEEHTSELQSQFHLVCRLLLEKKKKKT